jgi:hypothetical protein
MTATPHAPRPHGCLSDFALDRLLARELDGTAEEAAARAHLAGCARCAGRLAAFAAVVAPTPPAPAVTAAPPARPAPALAVATAPPASPRLSVVAGGPRPRRWMPAAAGVALAAGVAAVFALRPPADDGGGGTRVKGGATLGVWARRTTGPIDRIGDGDVVAPGDALRFEVGAARGGFAAVLALDAAGHVSVYAPADGAAMVAVAAGPAATLPGSIVADDTLGAERIVALVCAEPRPLAELRASAAAALARAGGDPRRAGELAIPCAQAAITVDKLRP